MEMDEKYEILNLLRDLRSLESIVEQLLGKLGCTQDEIDQMAKKSSEESKRWVLDRFPGSYVKRR